MKTLFQLPKGVTLLFINSLLMSTGFFAFVPYLSYHITESLLLTPVIAGIVLMARQLSQQGITFLTGALGDIFGYRILISFGMIVRGVGFLLFIVWQSPFGLIMAAVISGIGGSLFSPAGKAALTELTPPDKRREVFSLDKIMNNVGMITAAVIGGLLIQFEFFILSLLCGGFFIVGGIITYFRMPDIKLEIKTESFSKMYNSVITDRPFVLFTLLMVGYWFMYLQIYLSIPIYATVLFDNPRIVSVIYFVLAGIIILFQYPLQRRLQKYELIRIIQLGLLVMGSGLVILGMVKSIVLFVIGFILFTVGIMFIEPAIYDMNARLSKEGMRATYFGFSSFALAIGGSISQGLGGVMLQYGKDIGFPSLIWWICGLVALLSVCGLSLLYRKIHNQTVFYFQNLK